MTQIYLKPVAGRDSPDPAKGGALLPEKGDSVPLNAYWQRRINDGDVVKAEPPKAAKATTKAAQPADNGSAEA
ncbi:hypothetical protein PsexTeo8_42740 [Pseudomonas extremaustralis]|uniref:DUF2635 domain-containing protein n=1 Tax=Pseudomonas extremaustralis TaxID=359110 RepID=UPI002AA0C024|nr:DUF2635 domain-containing protein [Pseudomonas extremaustralis]MDY7067782.1 hypothetical protein [Pseudomonas extremaustralis]